MNRQHTASVKAVVTAVSLAAVLSLYSIAHAEELKVPEIMSAAQQNSVVRQYCGSCHSDALMYGGLSVEHFDAAHPEPSLVAMLVSKVTNGQSPGVVNAAIHGLDADATILGFMKASAMGAAGKGVPDEKTQVAFVKALSAEATGAEQWDSHWAEQPPTASRELTATIVRELASTKFAGKIDMYRLILTCRVATHEGEIKLAWANGVPEEGREITVEVDGKASLTHKVEGGKRQGNGSGGPGATVLYPSGPETSMPFPTQSLTIRNVFPDETVVFPFEDLSQTARRDLSTCFAADNRTH